jgi:hypothetical protein
MTLLLLWNEGKEAMAPEQIVIMIGTLLGSCVTIGTIVALVSKSLTRVETKIDAITLKIPSLEIALVSLGDRISKLDKDVAVNRAASHHEIKLSAD